MWILFLLIISTILITAQDKKETTGKFSGYMVGEYYNISDHNNKDLKGQHGFQFRRIYFTYDYKFNSKFSTRLRLEMNNDGKLNDDGKFDKIVISPFVKDAYLQYKFGLQKAYFGIASPPTFKIIEKVWGYRIVEKTPLDLQKMASSRDFGVGMAGQFDKSGMIKYHAMVANGSGNKQEIDKGKSFMASLSFWPIKELVLEGYADYADRAGAADTYITQGFLGYNSKTLHGGIQYSQQLLKAKDDQSEEITLKVLSVFLSGNILNNIKLLGRVDRMLEPNPKGPDVAYTPFNDTASFTEIIAGVDISVHEDIKIIPNVKFAMYDENKEGNKPANDLYANMTFYWRFK